MALSAFVSLACLPCAADEIQTGFVPDYVTSMIHPEISFANRCAAEDELRAHPDVANLARLLPLLDQYASDAKCGTGRCRSSCIDFREHTDRWPLPLQFDHAVNRTWWHTLENCDRDAVGEELIRLLTTPNTLHSPANDPNRAANRQEHLLAALDLYWIPAAEPAVTLLADNPESSVSWSARRVLAIHGEASQRKFLWNELTIKASDSMVPHVMGLVASPRYIARYGRDSEFRDWGFRKLESMPLVTRSDQLHALSLVLSLGPLAEQEFLWSFSSTGDEDPKDVEARRIQQELAAIQAAKDWWNDRQVVRCRCDE